MVSFSSIASSVACGANRDVTIRQELVDVGLEMSEDAFDLCIILFARVVLA